MPKQIRLIDFTIEQGRPGMPLVVFIHGLGMSATIWKSPVDEMMLGGLLRIGSLLGDGEHKTLWHDLGAAGYSLATWSQQRPVGPAGAAVRELETLMNAASELNPSSLIIISHSRGGLIARAWLGKLNPDEVAARRVKGLITISSPHQGSALARWAEKLRPAAKAIKDHLPGNNKTEFSKGLARALRFLSSTGVRELLPGSSFLASLPEGLPERIRGYSAGGTNPSFISRGWFSFPDTLMRFMPDSMRPDELIQGKGDGLVSARSAVFRLRDGLGHADFPCNHLTVLTDQRVREAVMGVVRDGIGGQVSQPLS